MSWQISCGFKNLDMLGVRINKIKNTFLLGFFKNLSKIRLFEKNTKDFPVKWTQIKYKGNSFIIFVWGPINLFGIFYVNKAIYIFLVG